MSDLLEEANEKCAGLLGEKFLGLSRGLLPEGTARQKANKSQRRSQWTEQRGTFYPVTHAKPVDLNGDVS